MELKPKKNKKEPEVVYEFIEREAGDTENELNVAFDILFEEVLKTQKSAKELSI
ncbi:MAG: hypothetical protein AAB595_02985 [Patescibacteria group bacterium]